MIELEKPKMVTADISDDGRYGKFVWEPPCCRIPV